MKAIREIRKPVSSERETCANQGCPRPPRPGERLCEACELEWSLFRRDDRRAEGAPSSR